MARKKIVGIYKVTSPSGRVYIGQSRDIHRRLRDYKNGRGAECSWKLNRSFIKYGGEAHVFEIAHQLPEDINQAVLDAYEVLYMSQYKDAGCEMLNIREGGRGGKVNEESARKVSAALKGRKHTDETKQKMSRALKGRVFTEEHRQNLSKSILAKVEQIKESKRLGGYTHSEATRQKIREAAIGRKSPMRGVARSAETKEKLRAFFIGKKLSEEVRRKMSASRTGRKMSEETKAKISASNKGRVQRLESIAKMMETKRSKKQSNAS